MYGRIEEIKNELAREIEKDTAYIEAWEKVEILTKKDGTPFANFAKNFSGATVFIPIYAMQSGERAIRVNVCTKSCGYTYDEINLYNLVKNMKDEKKLAKTENYQPKQTYLEQVYSYDMDDAKEAIENRIAYLKDRVETMKRQYENAETIFNKFKNEYEKLISDLEKDTEKDKNSTLFYAIKKAVL